MLFNYNCEIPENRAAKYCILQKEILEFIDSDYRAAEINLKDYSHASSAAAAYSLAIRRLRKDNVVRAITRSGHAYLIKIDEEG